MYNFCTLFNINYLSRGIAMYESLAKHYKDFKLYIFAFDDDCYNILKKLNYKNCEVISLQQFEDEELLKVKKDRTKGEYCWTCTASTILYVLSEYGVDSCTYLDSDLYFYNSPKILIEEMIKDSVLITEHRYTLEYDQTEISGKYCVQFMTFNNDERGIKALNWWRDACIDWCYARAEDGKLGDQKYLDDWTERFEGIHELKHLGGGVAPWNVQQYKFKLDNDKIIGIEKKSGNEFDLIFYHFHGFTFYNDNTVDFTDGYKLDSNVSQIIYMPYVKHLLNIDEKLSKMGIRQNYNNIRMKDMSIKGKLIRIRRRLEGTYNIINVHNIID